MGVIRSLLEDRSAIQEQVLACLKNLGDTFVTVNGIVTRRLRVANQS
jgi:hypothetical protein